MHVEKIEGHIIIGKLQVTSHKFPALKENPLSVSLLPLKNCASYNTGQK